MKVKTTVEERKMKGVVYKVHCGECDQVYIGEMGRNFRKRLKEQQYAVKKKDLKNGIAAHACQQQYRVDWSAAKVRCTEQHHWKRKVLEVIHIQRQANTSNLDCG